MSPCLRKSFEFEDIQHFRNRNSQNIHEELRRKSGSALYYTQSEDNIYEDIICKCPQTLQLNLMSMYFIEPLTIEWYFLLQSSLSCSRFFYDGNLYCVSSFIP